MAKPAHRAATCVDLLAGDRRAVCASAGDMPLPLGLRRPFDAPGQRRT